MEVRESKAPCIFSPKCPNPCCCPHFTDSPNIFFSSLIAQLIALLSLLLPLDKKHSIAFSEEFSLPSVAKLSCTSIAKVQIKPDRLQLVREILSIKEHSYVPLIAANSIPLTTEPHIVLLHTALPISSSAHHFKSIRLNSLTP